jgi:hypothetical protein
MAEYFIQDLSDSVHSRDINLIRETRTPSGIITPIGILRLSFRYHHAQLRIPEGLVLADVDELDITHEENAYGTIPATRTIEEVRQELLAKLRNALEWSGGGIMMVVLADLSDDERACAETLHEEIKSAIDPSGNSTSELPEETYGLYL